MLEVRLLGPVEVVVDGHPVGIGSASQRTLLAVLATRPGAVVSADRLIDVLWDGSPPESATATLQAYVSRLRKSVGADRILTRSPGYALVDATTDVARFEMLSARADDIEAQSEALELWRGDPFGDLGDREPFRSEALRLNQIFALVEEQHLRLLIPSDPSRAAAGAEALCEREPLREARWMLLAQALAAAGRVPDALRAIDRSRRALGEVGLEPSRFLLDLEDDLLGAAPVAPAGSVVGGGVAVPNPLGRLVGREEALRAVEAMLGTHRLVTLIGPGGVGKTKVAQEAAHRVAETFTDGIRWCDLAAHDTDDAVVPAVARAVGGPVSGVIEETLLASLRDRRLLLVIDNAEHLTSSPGTVILATSREPLRIPAERVFRVAPLDPEDTALDLFLQKAEEGGVPTESLDRATVREVCELLDGLPLALEMAAARLRTLDLTQLAERLAQSLTVLAPGPRTAGARHETLDAVVNWSAGLLDPSERLTLWRATRYAGAFTLESGEEILGFDPLVADRVPGLLGDLVDRSLLVLHRDTPRRYGMLETVRRVVERWADAPHHPEEVDRRHAAYYADLAERLGSRLLGPEESETAARVLVELPDLRAAVTRSMERGWVDPAIRICAALYPLVYHRLRADIAAWSERLFPVVEHSGHPLVPTVGAVAALAAVQRGDITTASEMCRRARDVAEDIAGVLRVAEVELDIKSYTGELDGIDELAGEMIEGARANQNPAAEMLALVSVGVVRAYAGDAEGAQAAVRRARAIEEQLRSDTLSAWADYLEAEIQLDHDPERAAGLLERAVDMAGSTGAVFVEGVAGVSLATVHARHGRPEKARAPFARTIRHWLSVGDWIHQWVTLRNLVPFLERLDDPEGAVLVLSALADKEPPAYGEEASRLEETIGRLQTELGDGYGRLEARGRRLDDRGVVDLALERLDG
jgi:predicted ATPase/DNA-binding SARP family transcriptional activator